MMSIEVSKDGKFAYSVGVDHVLVKYRLWDIVSVAVTFRTFRRHSGDNKLT